MALNDAHPGHTLSLAAIQPEHAADTRSPSAGGEIAAPTRRRQIAQVGFDDRLTKPANPEGVKRIPPDIAARVAED